MNARTILGHIYESHVKIFYKCSFCAKAFVDNSRMYNHIQELHNNEKDRQKVAEFSLLFKAPFLKAPNNLFITREGFEKRMSAILCKWKKKFLFKCLQCSKYFETIDKLIEHSSNWCQISGLEPQHVSNPFTDTEVLTNPTDRRISERDRREEMIQHLAQLEALSSHCNDCTTLTIDFRAHLTKHPSAAVTLQPTENISVTETEPTTTSVRVTRQLLESRGRPTAETRPKSVAAETQLTNTQPESVKESLATDMEGSQSSTEAPPRATRRQVESRTRPRSTSVDTEPAKSLEEPVLEILSQNEEEQIITPRVTRRLVSSIQSDSKADSVEVVERETLEIEESEKKAKRDPSPPRKRGRPSLTSSPSTSKASRVKVVDAKPFVEALGIDVLSNRKLLAFNRLDRQALAFGSTVKESSKPEGEEAKLTCGLCRYSSNSR